MGLRKKVRVIYQRRLDANTKIIGLKSFTGQELVKIIKRHLQ